MAEYTPSDEDVRTEYLLAHQGLDAQSEAGEAYDRWLAAHDARVRRDAAREALDGLAQQEMVRASGQKPLGKTIATHVAESALTYRDTHYPEETP